jgi:FkbM family methyltransferase
MAELVICGEKILLTDEHAGLFGSDMDIMGRHWKPNPGDVFIDAGFGPGTWTLVALAKGARTFSFDPKPYAVEILEKQIALNGFNQAMVVQKGLWNHTGSAPFGANSFKEHAVGEMPVTTLDEFFSEMPVDRVDCINMDVEWAEMEVIEGAQETIRKFLPKLVIEIHDDGSVQALEDNIKALGPYTVIRDAGFLIAEPEVGDAKSLRL